MKKILSFSLCLILVFAMAIPAFAVYETPHEDSGFFEYEGYSVHYRKMEAENQKGQILMIHGFAHTTYCWTDIATELVSEGQGGYIMKILDNSDKHLISILPGIISKNSTKKLLVSSLLAEEVTLL